MLEIVKRKVENGERVLIYTSWVRTDSQQKLLKLLTEQGYRTEIMTDKISPGKREDWVEKRVNARASGARHKPFTCGNGARHECFYHTHLLQYGLQAVYAASGIPPELAHQPDRPRVEVYMLYYRDTMQHKTMKLMASKLAVVGIIEGSFTEEGLAAMSDVQDMTSQMAKELMVGIKDNVEDIAASFKKMAVINPDRSTSKVAATVAPTSAMKVQKAMEPVHRTADPIRAAELEAVLKLKMKEKQKWSKKVAVDENQLNLFDFVA